jgi:hypothetical protein
LYDTKKMALLSHLPVFPLRLWRGRFQRWGRVGGLQSCCIFRQEPKRPRQKKRTKTANGHTVPHRPPTCHPAFVDLTRLSLAASRVSSECRIDSSLRPTCRGHSQRVCAQLLSFSVGRRRCSSSMGSNPSRELPTCQKNHRTFGIKLRLNIELLAKIVRSGP